MTNAKREGSGHDWAQFYPFVLEDRLNDKDPDIRLSFNDWAWLKENYQAESIDGYYLNGYGVQGLVLATLLMHDVPIHDNGIFDNSEGDTCYIHFKSLELALQAAGWAAEMIADPQRLREAICVARAHGLEDS